MDALVMLIIVGGIYLILCLAAVGSKVNDDE